MVRPLQNIRQNLRQNLLDDLLPFRRTERLVILRGVTFGLIIGVISAPLAAQKPAQQPLATSNSTMPATTPGDAQNDPTHGLDATVVATQEYLKTGQARAVRSGDFLAFPYGRSQPTLTCAPLRTCMIRLQAGETVLGPPALGDSERWITGLMATGPDGATPIVYVKPTDCDITTNIVISTDRHLYNVTLDSPPCGTMGVTGGATGEAAQRVVNKPVNNATRNATNNAKEPYTLDLTFYYPDETAQQWTTQTAAQAGSLMPLAASSPGVSPDRFNFAYTIEKDRHFPWSPTHVFDDGAHVYIKLPSEARTTAAPVLFVLNDDGTRAVLNYALSHEYYVTDRLFHRAVLVIAEGGQERRLTLTDTATPPASGDR